MAAIESFSKIRRSAALRRASLRLLLSFLGCALGLARVSLRLSLGLALRLAFAFLLRVPIRRRAARRGLLRVVGHVPARALELHSRSRDHLLHGPSALRA